MKKTIIFLLTSFMTMTMAAQVVHPKVVYTEKKTQEIDTLVEEGTLSAEAPLDIRMITTVDCPSTYSYLVEWKIYSEQTGESDPILDRFEEESDYTLTSNGTYVVKLTGTFFGLAGDTITDAKTMTITIAESKCTCPDGISPNGDGINDVLKISAKSLVSVKGCIFNRWGQKIVDINLDNFLEPYKDKDGNVEEEKYQVWDGYVGGKPAKDGVYFINLDAKGSDGVHYKIKKAINVLKSLRSQESEDQ